MSIFYEIIRLRGSRIERGAIVPYIGRRPPYPNFILIRFETTESF